VKSYTENGQICMITYMYPPVSSLQCRNMLHLYVKQLEPHLFNIYE